MLRFLHGIVVILLVASSAQSVVISLNITDGDRPLTLYEAPSSGRRDARGRPFKSIIIVSKNPGSESRDKINDLSPWAPSTSTTPSPMERATPTIPFFSISCSVGSSCSQIISARDTKTARPTFKPYSKEEIAKFKGPLSALFPPSALKNQSLIAKPQITSTTPTTSTMPSPADGAGSTTSWKLQTWTLPDASYSAVTPSPIKAEVVNSNTGVKSQVLRIRTTTPKPVSLTTPSPAIKPITLKPFSITSQFKLGASTKPSTTTTTEQPVRAWSTPLKSKPASAASFGLFGYKPASSEGHWPSWQKKETLDSRLRPTWVNGRPIYDYTITEKSTSVQGSGISQNIKFPETQTRKPQDWNLPERTSSQGKTKPEEINYRPAWSLDKESFVWRPRPQETLYTNPKTNNRVALITAASAARVPSFPPKLSLPPEVSVSSAVVGLRVAPKSIDEPAFVETINGHQIETDGEDVNLTSLIMKHELRPRPARRLEHQQPSRVHAAIPRQLERRYNHHQSNGWQPMIFPRK